MQLTYDELFLYEKSLLTIYKFIDIIALKIALKNWLECLAVWIGKEKDDEYDC